MKERLKVKNDFVFQRIFGKNENKDILISLLNAILGLKLADVEIGDNTKLEKDRVEDKQGILDVRAKTDKGIQINIEIQLVNQYNMDKRTLFYWSKMYAEQLNAGQGFSELSKTITINILDFNYIQLEGYHTSYHLREDTDKEYVLTDQMEIHFIELPKFRKIDPNIKDPLDRWLLFLENASEEVLDMAKSEDRTIEKAEKVLDWLSSDEETRRLYELREKAIHDEITRINGAKEEGRQEGRQQGKQEEKKEIAKNMLVNKIDIDLISMTTGLSRDEVLQIQKGIKMN